MSITSAFISHQIWLVRNASHEASLVEPFIRQMRTEINDAIKQIGDDNRTKARLQKTLSSLIDALYGITGDWDETLIADLKELGGYEAKWAANTLSSETDLDFVAPTPEQVWAAAKFNPLDLNDKPVDFARLMKSWSDEEIARLTTGVKLGFTNGQTVRQIIKSVTGAGGLLDISKRNSEAIVHTAVAHVSTQARTALMDRNSDIVDGYELVITLDARTSSICRNWPPKKVYKPDDTYQPKPPFHYRCRTTMVPHVPDYGFLDKGAKRAASGADGGMQIDSNTSYYDFLKQQPAWFIDKALGPVRGAIFRNAGMTPEEFRVASVDGFGRPLSLREMAETDKRVRDYLKGE